jgi:hypothetical protein
MLGETMDPSHTLRFGHPVDPSYTPDHPSQYFLYAWVCTQCHCVQQIDDEECIYPDCRFPRPEVGEGLWIVSGPAPGAGRAAVESEQDESEHDESES